MQQSYRGKQIHHLLYQRKIRDIHDFVQCELFSCCCVWFVIFVELERFDKRVGLNLGDGSAAGV